MATIVTEPPLLGTSAPNACATVPARIPAFQCYATDAVLGVGASFLGPDDSDVLWLGTPQTTSDPAYGVRLADGGSVSMGFQPWGTQPGGISYCRLSVSGGGSGSLAASITRPGQSEALSIPSASFAGLDGVTVKLPIPGTGDAWVADATNVSLTLTATGSVDVYRVALEGVFPVGSAYTTPWQDVGTQERFIEITAGGKRWSRSDTQTISSTEDFPALFVDGHTSSAEFSFGGSDNKLIARAIGATGGGEFSNTESVTERLFQLPKTFVTAEVGEPSDVYDNPCGYPDGWLWETPYEPVGGAGRFDTGPYDHQPPELGVFQADSALAYHPNVLIGGMSFSATVSVAPSAFDESDTPAPTWRLVGDGTVEPIPGDSEGRARIASTAPSPASGGAAITPGSSGLVGPVSPAAHSGSWEGWTARLAIDSAWVGDYGRPVPNRAIGLLSPWDSDHFVTFAEARASHSNNQRYKLLWVADGWDWDYPGGSVSTSDVAYRVRRIDGTWYTLGSGSQAKIRAADGSWYVENVTGAQAKVRLAAGSMGPGVDFGKE